MNQKRGWYEGQFKIAATKVAPVGYARVVELSGASV
jgi:hypothetical protein